MKPRSRPSALGDLVGAYLDKRGFTERIDLVSAVDRWAEVVGERVAANARADGVTADGQLWVIVRSSAWAAELSLMAPRILARLNEGRDGRITALRCRVGPVEAPPKPEAE